MKRYFSSIILSYKITIVYDQPLLVPSLLLHTLNTALPNSSQIKTEYCMEQQFIFLPVQTQTIFCSKFSICFTQNKHPDFVVIFYLTIIWITSHLLFERITRIQMCEQHQQDCKNEKRALTCLYGLQSKSNLCFRHISVAE